MILSAPKTNVCEPETIGTGPQVAQIDSDFFVSHVSCECEKKRGMYVRKILSYSNRKKAQTSSKQTFLSIILAN